MNINDQKLQAAALKLIAAEADEVAALKKLIDNTFIKACRLILKTTGRTVVLGMGKSGHIGGKIAATLASTGTPAFFVHPAEAMHGDLGMITSQDTCLLLSYSGETQEIISLLSSLKRLEVPIIAITGKENSTLAKHADAALILDISQEACPNNLAPTSSSTATLALGDAIAVALLDARAFSPQDFAQVHPGGNLGKRLLTVAELMHSDDSLPKINQAASLAETLIETSNKGLGICFIVDASDNLLGIFTDGDLRRSMQQKQLDPSAIIANLMTRSSITVAENTLAVDAINLMEKQQITALGVVNAAQKLIGVLHMHDLLKAKII